MKTKIHSLNLYQKQNLFGIKNTIFHSNKNKEDLKKWKKTADVQSQVDDRRLQETLGKNKYYQDSLKVFGPVTKAIIDANEKLPKKTQWTTKAIEELKDSNVYVRALELRDKHGISDGYLLGPSAIHIEPGSKSQFWLFDDRNGNCYDFVRNG